MAALIWASASRQRARIVEGYAERWWHEWLATTGRVFTTAEASLAGGHRVGAREAYLRASTYYDARRVWKKPLHGGLVPSSSER